MSRILAIISLLLSFTSFAQAIEPSDQAALLECDQLTFEADDLECTEAHCTLSGNALVTCGETNLRANRVILSFDPKGSFQGLSAQEEVSLESPSQRILCSKLDVESDQIRGLLTDASLIVRETRPDGTVGIRVTASGSINRLDEDNYKIAPASFSLCDCGDDALPSWSIKSLWMDLDTKDRATLYFPSLWIAPFGILELPILPLLSPVSVPLKPRAFGLLPPRLQFYNAVTPSVAFPLFIPIGESWDLTIAVGNRFDWTPPRLNPWTEVAAPRLDTRLRYHPTKHVKGQVEVFGVYDRFRGNARNRHEDLIDAQNDLRYDLQRRFQFRAKHRWNPTPKHGLFAEAQWVSDDLLLADQPLNYDDRISYYLPSRLSWFSDHPAWRFQVDWTHLQRLYNYESTSARSALNYSSNELDELSPAPIIHSYLKPISLNDWLSIDAKTLIARIGPSRFNSARKSQWKFTETVGIHAAKTYSAYKYRASQEFLAGLIPTADASRAVGASLTSAEISSPRQAKFAALKHTIFPRLGFKHVERLTKMAAYSEYLVESELRSSSQLLLALGQEFEGTSANNPSLSLELELPFELRDKDLLPLRITSQLRRFHGLSSRLAMTLSPKGDALRDLTASLAWRPTSKIDLRSTYLLLAPSASRFEASLWEYASLEDAIEPDARWIHGIRPSISLKLAEFISLGYRADIALPSPKSSSEQATEVLLHSLTLNLKSECRHCWDIGVRAQIRPDDSTSSPDIQLQIALSLGGFEISQ